MSEWLYFVIEMEIYFCNVWNENLLVKSNFFMQKKWSMKKMKNKKCLELCDVMRKMK